jgi:hypothetical protein
MADDNPFRRVLDEQGERLPRRELTRRVPLAALEKKDVPSKKEQLRTVADLGIADRALLQRNPKIAALTVRDLNDLAAQFNGIPTNNAKVAKLTVEDMHDIEGVFLDYKVKAATDIGRIVRGGGAPAASVDVSCCCCTPCCCCAAAEVEPIRA